MGKTLVDSAPYTAPASDAEMYARYGDYTRKLLIRQGVQPAHAEDAVQDVFTHLIRRNVRGMYEPEHLATHGGKKVRCAFRTFLTRQVILYARGIREKNQKLAGRELCVLDAPGESGNSWAESLAGSWLDDYSSLDDGELIDRMRAWLALQPPSGPASPDLVSLFEGLVEETRDGTPLQLSPGRRSAGLKQLRTALERSRNAPVPQASWEIGGITLSVQDVQQAIVVLEQARGIMVAAPLERAEHPLAKAVKGWYHLFSAEERKQFPELEVDPQTHRKPAGHVKLAVLHRLRRMLTELFDQPAAAQLSDQAVGEIALEFPQAVAIDHQASEGSCGFLGAGPDIPATAGPVPLAVPESAAPWDQIEATLWRLGGSMADVDACRSWAEQGGMVLA